MEVSFKIYYPTYSNGIICGNTLNNIPQSATIKITGNLGDIVPLQTLQTLSQSPATGSVLLKNGKEVSITVYCNVNKITIKCNDYINLWDNFDLSILINYGNYISYSNNFVIYGYDLGSTLVGTVNKYPFDIVLVQENYATYPNILRLPYSSFIAYRVPLTDKIIIKKTTSCYYDKCYYINANTGEVLLNEEGGTICYEDDIEIQQIVVLNGYTCTSKKTIEKIYYTPSFTLETNCIENCNDICSITLSKHEVKINANFSNVSFFSIDGVKQKGIKDYEIEYSVFSYDGSLIDSKNYSYNHADFLGNVYSFLPNNYTFEFLTPNQGDYLITVAIKIIGELVEVIEDVSQLIPNKKYLIYASSYDSNFVISGAANNNHGTIFEYNGVSPIFGAFGKLVRVYEDIENLIEGLKYCIITKNINTDYTLCSTPPNINRVFSNFVSNGTLPTNPNQSFVAISNSVYECYDSVVLPTCNFFTIDELNCNKYKINNLSVSDITVDIFKLNDNGIFENINYTLNIPALSSSELIINEDSIYKVTISNNNTEFNYFIISLCNLQDCLLNKIKDIACDNDVLCNDKDWYDFNAVVVNFFVFINYVQSLDIFKNIYTSYTNDDLKDLFTIKNILDRFKFYCNNCFKPCNCY